MALLAPVVAFLLGRAECNSDDAAVFEVAETCVLVVAAVAAGAGTWPASQRGVLTNILLAGVLGCFAAGITLGAIFLGYVRVGCPRVS
jgi:hypothetical protein